MDEYPEKKILSYEYIRGLVDGEGCFTFCPSNRKLVDGTIILSKIPTFAISMHERDEELLKLVRNTLKLKNRIYNYKSSMKDGYRRGRKAVLIVREIGSLKNVIVPLFYKKLRGYKRLQFENWIKNIELDPFVPVGYKIIAYNCRSGFYDRNPKY